MVDSPARPRWKPQAALAVSLLAVAATAGLGGLASSSSASDYARLEQPSWAPPSWVFGPVWTVLYAMMAVAAWLVWCSGPWSQVRPALTAYAVQLVLNAAWTPLFFGLGWRAVAFAELTLLWLLLIVTAVAFLRRSTAAGWLLAPYLIWTTFALCLNFSVWQLNS